jgi:hypothetical protein
MITDEQKTKINEIISAIESLDSRIDKGVVLGQEADDFFADKVRTIKLLFDNTSDEWRALNRWEHQNNFHIHNQCKSEIYAGDKEKQKLQKLLEVIDQLIPAKSDNILKKEFRFSVADAYEAKRFICSLFRAAGSKIIIVDEHLDDQFFEYIDIVPDAVQIQIITGDKKPIFWTLLAELKKKRLNIEARVNNISHCRYIVIDDSVFYDTDASLNTIGKKDIAIHKVEDIEKTKNDITGYWNNAKIK